MTTEPPVPPEPTPAPEPAAQPAPEMPAAPPPVAPAPAQPTMSTMSGESMVMIGGALVLASYLVFTLIANEFHQFIVQLIAAAFAVLIPLVAKDSVGKVASYSVAMKVIGYVIAVGGVFEILYDVRFQILDEAMAFLGAAVAYAGYVLAFLGARAIKT